MSDNLIPDQENPENQPDQFEEHAIDQNGGPELRAVSGSSPKKVYAGMWGGPEIAVAAISAFLLLLTVSGYLFFVLPAERELVEGRKKRDDLERQLQSAREKWGDIRDTESQVAKLLTSAEDFEFRFLKDESLGTTSVYQRINVLINAYGLKNTSGPDYVPLEIAASQQARQRSAGARSGRDKYKSLFPGIYVTTTVEGTYSDLRRFIRDIETSQEFVAITSIELEPADEEGKNQETQAVQVLDPSGQKTVQNFKKGRYRGNTVSLRIEMAAYFRRPSDQRQTPVEQETSPAASGGTD